MLSRAPSITSLSSMSCKRKANPASISLNQNQEQPFLASAAGNERNGLSGLITPILWANEISSQKKPHDGGEGGIRTLDRVAPMPDFKSGALNRSATSPKDQMLPEAHAKDIIEAVVNKMVVPNGSRIGKSITLFFLCEFGIAFALSPSPRSR